MSIRGVLFDFAGTLFHARPNEARLSGITDTEGQLLRPEAYRELTLRMTSSIMDFAHFDEEHARAWELRDLDPEMHRKAFTEAIRQAGVPRRDQAELLYDDLIEPLSWRPFPDTVDVLRALAERDIPVAVVSNIAFDIRPAFQAADVDQLVKEFVLSYEHGVIKPDEKIFQTALDAIGVPAEDALMVGDSVEADGGALTLGMQFEQVPVANPEKRPDALRDALAAHGLS